MFVTHQWDARTSSKTKAARADTKGEGEPNVETARASRALISNTAAVPAALLERFALPANTVIHHTVHKDSTLPLFQGRVVGGQYFQGKYLAKQCSVLNPAPEISNCIVETLDFEKHN